MATTIESELTAVVWKILVGVGDQVEAGDNLMILESMKMEIPVEAETGGTVTEIHVKEGSPVSEGDQLVTVG